MGTRTKLARLTLVALSLTAAAAITPRDARAEVDTFGIGNGHSLAYTAAAANEVINAYAPLTADAAVGATALTIGTAIGAPAGFAVGDLVMVWRATGLDAAMAPSGNQTALDLSVAGGGAIGRFEFARVTAVTATSLTLSKPLTQAFAKDLTQVLTVPEFTTVSVPAGTSIAATAWQTAGTGFAGGIVAFLANGAVTLDGKIHADARGFRGGKIDANFDVLLNCNMPDGTEAAGYAAKGEGVVATEFGGATHGGRGNRANGAGGGNCAENGGGGGGHAGTGGVGGDAILASNKGGLGGAKLDYSLLTRLGMGGGGGAGEQKNSVGSGGGAGGGVVFARVKSLAGTGQLSAAGETAANAGILGAESDGAGGGGAGGSILLRAVGNVTCGTATTKGGNGGNTAVIGLGTFGPGGGGAGGRVLIQAKDFAGCPIEVTPGTAGSAGVGAARGATAGGPGANQPGPAGVFCFSNAATDPQCANPTPVCDIPNGTCAGCSGPFGGGTPLACAVAVKPVCAPNGGCNPCDGDFGTASAFQCQLIGAPYCFLTGTNTGACGKCTTNTDCAGAGHGGTACNAASGTCGTPCTDDSQCKAGKEWCAAGVCIPKTPNGEHVPNQPPIDGNCTPANGKRTCLSSVCEPDDDLCGLKNGSPCDGINEECRSLICFAGDKLCGKPAGEPCTKAGECRSDACTNGVCTGCTEDSNCGVGKVCDKPRKECVNGCREIAGKSNCIPPKVCSVHDGSIGTCIDDAADAGTGGDGGAAADAGLIEGGGCACRTSMPISGSPLALAAAAVGAMLLARRRNGRRNDNDNDNQDQG
jgi:hypothetical protein